MPGEQVAHSLLQGRAGFPVPASEEQEAEGARLVDVGRQRLALDRSWLGTSLDCEADVGIDALEQLAIGRRQRRLPRLVVEGPVGAERCCPSSRPLAAEAANRSLRR